MASAFNDVSLHVAAETAQVTFRKIQSLKANQIVIIAVNEQHIRRAVGMRQQIAAGSKNAAETDAAADFSFAHQRNVYRQHSALRKAAEIQITIFQLIFVQTAVNVGIDIVKSFAVSGRHPIIIGNAFFQRGDGFAIVVGIKAMHGIPLAFVRMNLTGKRRLRHMNGNVVQTFDQRRNRLVGRFGRIDVSVQKNDQPFGMSLNMDNFFGN